MFYVTVLEKRWSKLIMTVLFKRFRDALGEIGTGVGTLLLTVPFVVLTLHMISEEITKCLQSISSAFGSGLGEEFPVNFAVYQEHWTVETFRNRYMDLYSTAESTSFKRVLKMVQHYQLIKYGLSFLMDPSLLPVVTDYENKLTDDLNRHAHRLNISYVIKTLEAGATINDNVELSQFSRGCLRLMQYIERAEPLLVGSEVEHIFEDNRSEINRRKIAGRKGKAAGTAGPGPSSSAIVDLPSTRSGRRYGPSTSARNDSGSGPQPLDDGSQAGRSGSAYAGEFPPLSQAHVLIQPRTRQKRFPKAGSSDGFKSERRKVKGRK